MVDYDRIGLKFMTWKSGWHEPERALRYREVSDALDSATEQLIRTALK